MGQEQRDHSRNLTIREACDELRISPATLHRMFKRGELVRRKVGRRTLVRRAEVDALVERGGEGVFQ